MKRKSKLFIGILVIVFITISAFLLYFLLRSINKDDVPDLKESIQASNDSPALDYPGLDLVLQEVPDNYTIFLDDEMSDYLSNLLDYVKDNKAAMNRQTANAYTRRIREIIISTEPLLDVVQVFIKVDDGNDIYSNYSSASIAIIDTKDGQSKDIIDLSAKIKVRGNSTTEVAKKSYTVKFSNKENVLGMGKAKKWVLIANSFDKTLMRNKLVFDFASAIGLKYSPESNYADVWLNGKFIGNYLLSELIEASPSRVDIDTDQGDFLIEREDERYSAGTTYFTTPIFGYRFGINDPQDITPKQLEKLTDFLGKMEMAIQDRDWKAFTGYVDEKSYIDFYILSELFKVVDFDYASTRFYIKNGRLYAGPPWDNDLSSGNADADFYFDYNQHAGFGQDSSYIGLWCTGNFYAHCFDFPEFKEALRIRYEELQEIIQNLYEDNSLGVNRIDLLLEKYGASFDRNYTAAGWTLKKEFMLERNPDATYEQNVEYLRDWLKKRNKFLTDSFD